MFESVDIYCERTTPEFWAEPVNALTNGFFLLSAWLIWRRARRVDALTPAVWLLLWLMFAIGIGSSLFHTFATQWAMLADILPILFFQLTYLWLYCREIAALRVLPALAVVSGLLVAVLVMLPFSQLMNGSLIYVPALLVLLILGIYHRARRRREPNGLLLAGGVFLLSLTLRTLDNPVCSSLPLGTHFLWHTGNAVVLYLVMSGFIANRLAGSGAYHQSSRTYQVDHT
jgi:hypothetical protein